ncbi:hypothetical protein V8C86DRAFT_2832076 [Haematococcus lacustris]
MVAGQEDPQEGSTRGLGHLIKHVFHLFDLATALELCVPELGQLECDECECDHGSEADLAPAKVALAVDVEWTGERGVGGCGVAGRATPRQAEEQVVGHWTPLPEHRGLLAYWATLLYPAGAPSAAIRILRLCYAEHRKQMPRSQGAEETSYRDALAPAAHMLVNEVVQAWAAGNCCGVPEAVRHIHGLLQCRQALSHAVLQLHANQVIERLQG